MIKSVVFGFAVAAMAFVFSPKAQAQAAYGESYLTFVSEGAQQTNIARLNINFYCPNPYLRLTNANPTYVPCADTNEYGEWERARCYTTGQMRQPIRVEGRGFPGFVDLQAFTNEPVWSGRYDLQTVRVQWELYCH